MTNKLKFGQIKPNLGIPINWGNPLAKGLVGYWPMLEGAGNTISDLSGNGNDGNLVADTHWVGGKFGPCLSFDGSGDGINCGSPHNFNGSVPFSAIAWIKTSLNQDRSIFGTNHDTGWYLRIEAGTGLRAKIDDGANDAHEQVACSAYDGNWHQVGIVLTDSKLWTIFDGKIIKDIDNGAVNDLADTFNIGAIVGADPFNGSIDDVMIYNRALSASEVAELYRNPFGMFERDEIALWQSVGGGIEYIETGLAISFTAAVAKGTDVSAMVDTAKAITLAASIVTEVDAKHVADINLAMSLAASITATDTKQYTETERAISFAATITKTDISAMVDTEKALTLAASITAPNSMPYSEIERAVSFAASIAETDIRVFLETNRAVTFAASIVPTDTQQMSETELAVSASIYMVPTDTQQMSDTELAVSASIYMVKEFTEWYGVGSEHLVSYCGQEDNTHLTWALDGSNRWYHSTDHTHYFILDLGSSVNLIKFRSRSNQTDDPTDVDIYVSETNGDWGAAVAEGITTWQDSADWVEYDSTDKQGRYIKVEIVDTENVGGNAMNYGEGPIFDAYGAYTEQGSDTHQMADTAKDVTAALAITKTDNQQMVDLARSVSVAASCPGETRIVGETTILGTSNFFITRRAMPFVMAEAGTLESISIYHGGGSGSLILAVYDNTGADGLPGNRLGMTPQTAVAAGAGWQTIALGIPVDVLAGQTIWLAWIFENSVDVYYTTGTPGRASSVEGWAVGMPEGFGDSTQSNYIYSIHALYVTQSDVMVMKDLNKAVSVAASFATEVDAKHVSDTGLAVTFAAAPSIGTEIFTLSGAALFHLAAFVVMRQTHH